MSTTETSPPTPAPPALRLRYAALSDVGRYRSENQDSGYASERLLVVADGVGGAAYGDVASATAVQVLRRLDDAATGEMLPALAGAVHRVHDRLAEMVEEDPELEGTSTTVTAALFDGRRWGFVHIGDSRAYLLRAGELTRLTTDHTFVQSLVDEGRISEDEARVHPHRNIILRAVDGVHDTDPDLFHVEPRPGDRVLLCSDGCSGALTDAQLAALLGAESVDAAALQLVQSALDHGSTDNVTVVVAEVVDADTADDPRTSAAATVGTMLVGAAAEQPRRGGGFLGRGPRRQRVHDTGEMDPVSSSPTVGGDADPEELRYAPRAPRRHSRLRRALLVLVPLLLLAAVLGGGYAWSQEQYYVAADGDHVAIYRGVEADLPGVRLSHRYQRAEDLPLAALPPFRRKQVEEGIVADDLAQARRILADLRTQAEEQCAAAARPSPTPTTKASPTPTGKARPRSTRTPRPSAGPSATPRKPRVTATPSPTPTATPTPASDDCAELVP